MNYIDPYGLSYWDSAWDGLGVAAGYAWEGVKVASTGLTIAAGITAGATAGSLVVATAGTLMAAKATGDLVLKVNDWVNGEDQYESDDYLEALAQEADPCNEDLKGFAHRLSWVLWGVDQANSLDMYKSMAVKGKDVAISGGRRAIDFFSKL